MAKRKRLDRDWARQLRRATRGASSIGVKVGHYARGRSKDNKIAAGAATGSLEAFIRALGSLRIPHKVVFVDEAWTSTYCFADGAT